MKGTPMPSLWMRFIDDIFGPISKENFLEFFSQLNQQHPNIKYIFEVSNTSISFLDLTIHKGNAS